MSASLHIVIRCDARLPTNPPRRCPQYITCPPSLSVPDARTWASKQSGWTCTPGQPYVHINATDYCPEHPKGKRLV